MELQPNLFTGTPADAPAGSAEVGLPVRSPEKVEVVVIANPLRAGPNRVGSDVGRIVRAAGDAKDDEGVNFFFGRTHQDGTTVAACKFDGRVGHLQRWRCRGHRFNERGRHDLESFR